MVLTLTRQLLDDYSKLEREIKRINKKLDYYANNPLRASHGVVSGSMTKFPYAECHFVVGAPSIPQTSEREKQVRSLIIELGSKKNEYENLKTDIDIAIELIDDMEMRQIFQYKYIDEMTDAEIGKKLGYDRSTISKKIEKFFKDELSHNSHS